MKKYTLSIMEVLQLSIAQALSTCISEVVPIKKHKNIIIDFLNIDFSLLQAFGKNLTENLSGLSYILDIITIISKLY